MSELHHVKTEFGEMMRRHLNSDGPWLGFDHFIQSTLNIMKDKDKSTLFTISVFNIVLLVPDVSLRPGSSFFSNVGPKYQCDPTFLFLTFKDVTKRPSCMALSSFNERSFSFWSGRLGPRRTSPCLHLPQMCCEIWNPKNVTEKIVCDIASSLLGPVSEGSSLKGKVPRIFEIPRVALRLCRVYL